MLSANSQRQTLMYSIIGRVLKRDELEQFIASHDISSAIKTIAYKPLGLYLSHLITVGITLENISKSIDEYVRDTMLIIYRNTPRSYRGVIYSLEKPYDLVNLSIMYSNLRGGNRATPLFPAGVLYAYGRKAEKNEDLLGLIKELGLSQRLGVYVVEQEKVETLILKGFEVAQKTFYRVKDPVLRRIYGLIYDYTLLRSIIALGKEHAKNITVNPFYINKDVITSISGEDYTAAIEKAIRHIGLLNNIYSDVSRVVKGLAALDYTHILSLAVESTDLILPNTLHPYVRALLLVRAEALLFKLAVLSVLGYNEKNTVKNIISKWWII